ncbi:hypothetical protein [Nonomuraea sp. SBT364]|uniref:hypothetical protein n=1 Tax=Nonomuraea sp. SBT364 TaxID=1580530 RepID=UPI000AEC0983|nr:hypothetical protein [Nonomuraea sp. SBT364]
MDPSHSPAMSAPRMSNTTRYLCGATYLDNDFRDKVLAELLLDPFRAVPPSYGGCDLLPIIHHARRSRSMLVVRDGLITAILLLGFALSPMSVIGWLSFLLPFVLLTLDGVRRGPALVRGLLWFWALGSYVILFVLVALLASLAGLGGAAGALFVYAFFESAGSFLVPLATLGVAVLYRIIVYTTLAGSLKPGAPPPAPAPEQPKTADRLGYVARAQTGNITMYANEDAFMGAGGIQRSWSIAVELDRVRTTTETGRGTRRRERPVDIDPAELHAFVRTRLTEMREQVLRPNEGIRRLDIGDHVVARGIYTVADWPGGPGRGAHPLIDQHGLPRYLATPEEIAAISRHPQGGIRYYQRVTISHEGQEIRDTAGHLVAPAEDQEAVTSAFIYLAVEGRMLYTQFVVTALPPAKKDYHVVDQLPTMTGGRIAWEAVRALKLLLLRDVLAAPVRLARTAVRAVRQQLVTPDPSQHVVYPYGARLSVRELGASAGMQTYIQRLDTAKYVKLIEHRLTESVLDFLEDNEVETGAYRMQAANVMMDMSVRDSVINAPIAMGLNASASMDHRSRG